METLKDEGSSHPKQDPSSPQGSHSPKDHKFWARWEYSAEEWKQFDRIDWGGAIVRLLLVVVGAFLLSALLAIYFAMQEVSFTSSQHISRDFIFQALLFLGLFLLAVSLPAYFLIGRDFLEARKRHQMRKADARKVTIGKLSPFSEQGFWLAGTFVPLQEASLRLKKVKMTANPPRIHFQRQHMVMNQSSLYDTIRILVPRGREAEAAKLVKRFQVETIQAFKKHTSPPEP